MLYFCGKLREPPFALFVEKDIQACIRRVPDGRRAEAGEEASQPFLREDGVRGRE